MIYRIGKAIQKYWKYPAGAVAAISTLTNLQTFHSHSQINSGHKPRGIYPECVKNFNSSIDPPPGIRPIACSPKTTHIEINNQNVTMIRKRGQIERRTSQ
jgi:hypothetical protein